jgi:hypothetical protein
MSLEHDDQMVTIILPEFLPRRWWQHALHTRRRSS